MSLQTIVDFNRQAAQNLNVAQEVANIFKSLMDIVGSDSINSYTFNDRKVSVHEGNISFVRQFHVNINIIGFSIGLVHTDREKLLQLIDGTVTNFQHKIDLLNIHDKLVLLNTTLNPLVPVPEGSVYSHAYFFSTSLNEGTGQWADEEEQAKWKILPQLVQGLVDFPEVVAA